MDRIYADYTPNHFFFSGFPEGENLCIKQIHGIIFPSIAAASAPTYPPLKVNGFSTTDPEAYRLYSV